MLFYLPSGQQPSPDARLAESHFHGTFNLLLGMMEWLGYYLLAQEEQWNVMPAPVAPAAWTREGRQGRGLLLSPAASLP